MHTAPGSMPRVPTLQGVSQPPTRVALPPDYPLLQPDLDERIEAALAAEFELRCSCGAETRAC